MKICITYYIVAESVEVLHFKTCCRTRSSDLLQNNEWFLRLWGKAKPCLFVQRKPVPVMCSMMSRRFWTTRPVLTPKWRSMADWWALAVWCAAVSKSPFWGCQESWNGVFHYQPSILGYHKSIKGTQFTMWPLAWHLDWQELCLWVEGWSAPLRLENNSPAVAVCSCCGHSECIWVVSLMWLWINIYTYHF